MQFVNEIVEITHGTDDSIIGAPNKNFGELFFLRGNYRLIFFHQDK